jgi:RsmE family RNA methyltransferase
VVLFFNGNGEKFTTDILVDKESVGIFIGPEGGFSEVEMDLARQKNLAIVTLGARTLRAETASAVATYLAAN